MNLIKEVTEHRKLYGYPYYEAIWRIGEDYYQLKVGVLSAHSEVYYLKLLREDGIGLQTLVYPYVEFYVKSSGPFGIYEEPLRVVFERLYRDIIDKISAVEDEKIIAYLKKLESRIIQIFPITNQEFEGLRSIPI